MKKKHIDEFGDEYYSCDRCREIVDEYDEWCDICGNSLLATYQFPLFENKEMVEAYYKNNKFRIMSISQTSHSKYGKCILVEANPITLMVGMVYFTSYICDETIRLIYPDTQNNLEYLSNTAQNSLLEINFNEFKKVQVLDGGESISMYSHLDFFLNKLHQQDRKIYNGIIDSSLISKTDKENIYKILLPNGDCYIGEINNSIISGWGEYYFSNGKNISNSEDFEFKWARHYGSFRNGLPNGIGTFVSESRDYPLKQHIIEWGYFINGIKNGVCLGIYDGISEVGIYNDNKMIKDLAEYFTKIVGIKTVSTFWYKTLGIWIGTIYSDFSQDYNGLLILNNGDCYIGTMPGGFNRTKIVGLRIYQNGIEESGEWILDINNMTPTEYAFI